jgi:integrase
MVTSKAPNECQTSFLNWQRSKEFDFRLTNFSKPLHIKSNCVLYSSTSPTPTIQVNATRKIRRALSESSADSRALREYPADGLAALAAFMATAAIVVQIALFKKERVATGVGNASVNRSIGLLRRMFSIAVRQEQFPKDRVPFFEMLEEPQPRVGFLRPEEFVKLRAELPENLRPVLALGYYCGMRLGEIQRLQWSGVDLKRGEITLQGNETKNGRPRAIPLMLEVPAMLNIMRQKNPQVEYVFGGDRPLGNFRKTWNSACVRAGLGRFEKRGHDRKKYVGFIFHSLRRTALTNMADAGVSAHAAMSISGHLSQKVFNDYLQMVERQAKEAKRKMEIYLGHHTETLMEEKAGIAKSVN